MPENDPLLPYTAFPNALIDDIMPLLRDTQWRVLCVVVRQTIGWRSPDGRGRKSRDWLTQSQLKRRTGRASEALSRAVDGLVRRGLIEVVDEQGSGLTTAAERRRCRGRLYYRLGAALDAQPTSNPQRYPQGGPRSVDNRRAVGPPMRGGCSETEHRNPKTTERHYYYKCNEVDKADPGGPSHRPAGPSLRRDGWFRAGDVLSPVRAETRAPEQ